MLIKDKKIDGGKAFDWSRVSDEYAKYRDIYPKEFYHKILERGLCKNGQSILDIGTGTGVLPRNMYEYGGKWTGIDISEEQIRQAKQLSAGKDFSVCKVTDYSLVNLDCDYCFTGKTDEEKSLVCITSEVPANTIKRDDGWKAFRIQGVLDFSLIGILAKITGILAENNISVFAVSTYNTDYVLLKMENYQNALEILERSGYEIVD